MKKKSVQSHITARARAVLSIEAQAVHALRGRIGKAFEAAVGAMARSRGRVVVSGMGKTGIIAQKFSATLASTGTASLYLHTAEAIHGDLGRVREDDVVVIISNSGHSEEIKQLMPLLKKIGSKIIGMTGSLSSVLAKYSDIVLDVSVKKEACPLNLAPTASTTAALALCDALAVCVFELKGFKERDFAFFHPGGALGKRLLLKVEDIMRRAGENPVVRQGMKVSEVLLTITRSRAGSATVTDNRGRVTGIFTDGDLRRHIDKDPRLTSRPIEEVMTKNPTVVSQDMLAAEAARVLREKSIDELPVVDSRGRAVGLLDVQDLLKAGII
jgi:arabinose-5-phosphate isomerase